MNIEWIILLMVIFIIIVSVTTMELARSLVINILFVSIILLLKLLIRKVNKEHEV